MLTTVGILDLLFLIFSQNLVEMICVLICAKRRRLSKDVLRIQFAMASIAFVKLHFSSQKPTPPESIDDHGYTTVQPSSLSNLTAEQKLRVKFNQSLANAKRNLRICAERVSKSSSGQTRS
ncbi:hypothetical protein L1987_54099 [Smallanthus sonchifolius]|uniref:Uncharacterized protein n=1 Tax=Smallanthus sonchifolius TaxID=185202 RepID=A0ACB9E7F4_9ASTR|nr:hypothetical protein L1987_54099 [Smallanthus sonchifolius]